MKKNFNNIKIGIVASRFNGSITQRLLKACVEELADSGIKESNIQIVWVPGAFEIPVVALKLAQKKSTNAVICLGTVIKGETMHFELVSYAAAWGVSQVALSTEKPIIFEVLSTYTTEQANQRSKIKGDNKGRDAARAALEMISVLKKI